MYLDNVSLGRVIPAGTGVLGVDDLDAAPGVHGEYIFLKRAQVKRLLFFVTEAVLAATTAPVIRFSKRVTIGSDTNAVVLSTMTIPSGAVVGACYYIDIEPVTFEVGDCLKLENTVQTVDPGSSTETGQGYYGFEADFDPEQAANESNMVAASS